jgi:hypothetical protein
VKEDHPMIVLNDKDKSLIDESHILELFGALSGYDAIKAPELKYKLEVNYRSGAGTRVYFYAHWDDLLHDRKQLIEILQARTLTTRG